LLPVLLPLLLSLLLPKVVVLVVVFLLLVAPATLLSLPLLLLLLLRAAAPAVPVVKSGARALVMPANKATPPHQKSCNDRAHQVSATHAPPPVTLAPVTLGLAPMLVLTKPLLLQLLLPCCEDSHWLCRIAPTEAILVGCVFTVAKESVGSHSHLVP
jgi:hypothetical protein